MEKPLQEEPLKNSQIHHLALAGLLYGIDHFILAEKKNVDFPLNGPLFEKIRKFLTEKEQEYLKKLTVIIDDIPSLASRPLPSWKPSSLSCQDFPDNLEEKWTLLTTDEVDNFFSDIKNNFSHMSRFPHCQILSALLACGEYPFICGGKIVEEPKHIYGELQGNIVSGHIVSRYIFNTVLPVFQARFYPIPLSCIIEINSSAFYTFLPGPVAYKGEKHLEEINDYLWEQRQGDFFLCWDAIDFAPEEIKKLPLLLFRLDEFIRRKSLSPFKKYLLDEGKHIFYINYKHGLCKYCKENPSSLQDKSICLTCKKNIKLAEKSSELISSDLSPIIREEKYFPEIIKNNIEEELLKVTEKAEFIPVFYPLLPASEEWKKNICAYCKNHDSSECIQWKSCTLTCMAALSAGHENLSTACLEIPEDSDNPLTCLNRNNITGDIFSYLKSPAIIKALCHKCSNKDICNNEVRCFYTFILSDNKLRITGAWDKVLNVVNLINSLERVKGNVILHQDIDRLYIKFREVPDCINIFGVSIRSNMLKDLMELTVTLSESIEKGYTGKGFISYLYECRELIDLYFHKKDKRGLKFLPKITFAIKEHVSSEEIREKMKMLLEIDEEKSIVPYISFIIKYLNLTLDI